VLEALAKRPPLPEKFKPGDVEELKNQFLARFEGDDKVRAGEVLDLGRASYRLRDDDNIHLGAIEREWLRAVAEGRGRLERRGMRGTERLAPRDVAALLRDPTYRPATNLPAEATPSGHTIQPRQLLGQAAGPGVATGIARVASSPADLFEFEPGEILVCDAVDPNMTFVVPLVAGIIERRGGMLIHGAIIAREYGLPCVTGVPDATGLIWTGAKVTVDGYLGIVTVSP
jgi:pyruvate,water dikinase